jgi:DNA-binding ferritin-like protein
MEKSMALFLATMLHSGTNAHFFHWATKSYAKHKALGGFYDNVIDLADKFAEAYQGRHGLIGPISLHSARKTSNITEFLEDSLKEIEDMRYKVCDKSDTALQNIIDEIVGL